MRRRTARAGAGPSTAEDIEAALQASQRRVQILQKRLLAEKAARWGDLAKFERAGLRLPEQKKQGVRYKREVWRDVYHLITRATPGATGYTLPAPDYAHKVAEHLRKASEAGELTSEWQAPGAWIRVALPRATPFGSDDESNRKAALAYIVSQTGQKPRAAWRMLKDVGTKDLPPRPR